MAVEGVKLGLALALVEIPIVALGAAFFARRIRFSKYIRPEGPALHAKKAGTPTMGGVVPLATLALALVVAWAAGMPISSHTGFALAATTLGGLIGLVDDLLAHRRGENLGLKVWQKLFLQGIAGCALAGYAFFISDMEFLVPFSETFLFLPNWAKLLLVVFGFMGTTNAVNLTDGLDGLATGASLVALFGFLPLVWGQVDLSFFVLLGIGACGGFLWVNAYPASIFLGDVGSMGLGGLIFGIAFASRNFFFLLFLGGLFWLEALSVILQVGSYKLTGKRLFKMSPFHHHLEQGEVPWPHFFRGREWPEPKVVVRLWLLEVAFVLLGILAWIWA